MELLHTGWPMSVYWSSLIHSTVLNHVFWQRFEFGNSFRSCTGHCEPASDCTDLEAGQGKRKHDKTSFIGD